MLRFHGFTWRQEIPMLSVDRTSQDWFHEAARCYVEAHQGCAWCGGSHRVYFCEHDTKVQYYCSACDFRAGFNRNSNSYYFVPGQKKDNVGRSTMFQI